MSTAVKVGIATGAGRGMGLECGRELLALVNHVILVDRDADTVNQAAAGLQQNAPGGVVVEPFVLDITDRDGLNRLAAHAGGIGSLRAVAHAAGISPTMADWRRIFEVDLVGSALLIEALRPLASNQTAFVCFSSMSPLLLPPREDDAALNALMARPLAPGFMEQLKELAGPAIENTGWAYGLAKRGVKALVQHEAVALGAAGARICSIAPGVIATPQGNSGALCARQTTTGTCTTTRGPDAHRGPSSSRLEMASSRQHFYFLRGVVWPVRRIKLASVVALDAASNQQCVANWIRASSAPSASTLLRVSARGAPRTSGCRGPCPQRCRPSGSHAVTARRP